MSQDFRLYNTAIHHDFPVYYTAASQIALLYNTVESRTRQRQVKFVNFEWLSLPLKELFAITVEGGPRK